MGSGSGHGRLLLATLSLGIRSTLPLSHPSPAGYAAVQSFSYGKVVLSFSRCQPVSARIHAERYDMRKTWRRCWLALTVNPALVVCNVLISYTRRTICFFVRALPPRPDSFKSYLGAR
ncbi:hypothetical protein BJV74DRAFT_833653 [Russula compacta]|nr:hypothetical protein BJV74DRAFT_833653 [Russula compacta]